MRLRLEIALRLLIYRVVPLIIVFAIAFGITAILIYFSEFNPAEVYWGLFTGGFGSIVRFGLTLNEATPLLFCALGLILAFRCGIWNVGAEGQLYMGAVGAALVGIFLTDIPKPLVLLLAVIASFVFGAVWGAIPGILKVKYKTNEIITSLLMVFIAIHFINYLVLWPLKPAIPGNIVTERIADTARMPIIIPGTASHAGILIALGLAVVVWFILQKSTFGYRIKAIGINPDTALYGGISIGKITINAMAISGGLAGLAGMAQVSGVHYLLGSYISSNYGFLGILVAFIGRLHPFGAVLVAIFLGGLLSGSKFVQMDIGIDVTVVHVLVAVIMLSLVLEPAIEKSIERHLKIR